MSDMRTRIVGRFRSITTERLERMNNTFIALQDNPLDADTAKVLKREIHTLKGESRMTGFRLLGDVVHLIEELLKELGQKVLDPTRVQQVFSGFDLLSDLVDQDPGISGEEGPVQVWMAEAQATLEPPEPDDAGKEVAPAQAPEPPPKPAPKPAPAPVAQPAPEPEPEEETGQGDAKTKKSDDYKQASLRVALHKLDEVTQLAGDLSLSRQRGVRSGAELQSLLHSWNKAIRAAQGTLVRLGPPKAAKPAALVAAIQELTKHFDDQRQLNNVIGSVAKRTDDDDFDLGLKLLELDDRMRELRFLPLSSLFARFPRAVRDVASEQKKVVKLDIRGGAVEMDKQVIDRIAEPLLHLVRNGVDHGIETPEERIAAGKPPGGTIVLHARTLGSAVEITIRDDGRGMDRDKIRAAIVQRGELSARRAKDLSDSQVLDRVFESGFSTRKKVTQISGRGVGLAVVKDTVEQLGGHAHVRSLLGHSSTFELRVPTSVVLATVLLVRLANRYYALAADVVVHTLYVAEDEITESGNGRMFRHNNVALPITRLGNQLGVASEEQGGKAAVVVVEHRGKQIGLRVDSFAGQHQAIQRPLDPFISGLQLYHGTIGTSDGEIALLLNVAEVVRRAQQGGRESAYVAPDEAEAAIKVLVVDDSEFTRDLVVNVFRDMDFDVVEAVNGRQGLDRFRDHSPDLVLTDLDMPVMDGFGLVRGIRARPDGGSVPIIVFSTRGSADDKERAAALGADAYLVKTEFREENLLTMVRQFLDLSQAT